MTAHLLGISLTEHMLHQISKDYWLSWQTKFILVQTNIFLMCQYPGTRISLSQKKNSLHQPYSRIVECQNYIPKALLSSGNFQRTGLKNNFCLQLSHCQISQISHNLNGSQKSPSGKKQNQCTRKQNKYTYFLLFYVKKCIKSLIRTTETK